MSLDTTHGRCDWMNPVGELAASQPFQSRTMTL